MTLFLETITMPAMPIWMDLAWHFLMNIDGIAFADFRTDTIDISEYRSSNLQLIFEYDDGETWAWWAGLDNVKIEGDGFINEICDVAESLTIGDVCKNGSSINSIFSGNSSNCFTDNLGSLWYSFEAPQSQKATIFTNATFNDVVTG